MGYRSLEIKDFRGIKQLEIKNLKPINLLVGRNNCGKTSVLESLFLLSGMSNPQLSVNIHKFRDLTLINDEGFKYMFHQMDFKIPIKIKGNLNGKNRELIINPFFTDYPNHLEESEKIQDINNPADSLSVSTNIIRLIEGLTLEFKTQKQTFIGEIHLKENKVKLAADYQEDFKCAFLNPKTFFIDMDKRMENLLIQKRFSSIIQVLQSIEAKLINVSMGGTSGMIYVDIGSSHLLPLNILGDGMRRILAILVAIADHSNGLLLIDEIENGFHYSSLSVLWRSVIAACLEYNVQLVATSHSLESIEALSNAYTAMNEHGDDICVFRIDRNDQKHTAHQFTAELLRTGIENEFEIR
jgi:AAA15 family ATPase/GTPase